MSTATDVVVLSGARTPQGKILGHLASFTAAELGAHAIRAAAMSGCSPYSPATSAATAAVGVQTTAPRRRGCPFTCGTRSSTGVEGRGVIIPQQ